ncbi:LytTR family DNA-binding domain-containing protein [uncultured Tenacibaculum sp.]|uniref:LytR/AlgR family response regulator transcription factor n=1 Tax=uncultured Tenacibaculum sp. TaxID=174713 RepID=UPI00262711EF|nr:LytTR family DNA-binding domain-containing protein [uncultured Tenacibaculum sp.]
MKALIIDDENKAIRLLNTLLLDNCPEIKAVFKSTDLISGVAIIEKEEPDIVFLDIEMPNYSGLQILDFFKGKEIKFQIIFVTAYNKYAVEAFKLSATDYLLKPLDVEELIKSVNKAVKLHKQKSINNQFNELKKAFKQLSLNKIALEIPKGIVFVSHDDIQLFEADGMYTKVYLNNKKVELICKPLKYFVTQLKDLAIFYKPHRSYLINLKHIKEFIKKDGFYLLMNNGESIPITKDKKEGFLQLIQEYF